MARIALIHVAVLCVAFASEPNRLSDDEQHAGWRLLFDGCTTAGWVEVTGKPFPKCWTVEDGSLKSIVRTDGAQDIRTTDSFRSFDLQFDWKLLAGGNSGIKYLVQRVDEWTNKAGRQARARASNINWRTNTTLTPAIRSAAPGRSTRPSRPTPWSRRSSAR